MAKRFTSTDKYKDPFLRGLQGPYKVLWDYIQHECDHAGIWIVDFEIAQIYVGRDLQISREGALDAFSSMIVEISDGSEWFIPSFIESQYGELNPTNRVHQSALNILYSKNLIQNNKPLTSPLQGAKDKVKVMDKEKLEEKNKKENEPDFEIKPEIEKQAEEFFGSETPVFPEKQKESIIDRYNKNPMKMDTVNYPMWDTLRELWPKKDGITDMWQTKAFLDYIEVIGKNKWTEIFIYDCATTYVEYFAAVGTEMRYIPKLSTWLTSDAISLTESRRTELNSLKTKDAIKSGSLPNIFIQELWDDLRQSDHDKMLNYAGHLRGLGWIAVRSKHKRGSSYPVIRWLPPDVTVPPPGYILAPDKVLTYQEA